MSEIDRAWLAGLFEGEGWSNIYLRPDGTPYVQMGIQSTDYDIIERVQRIAGGTIIPIRPREEHHKPSWQWNPGVHSAGSVLRAIVPYLGVRRRANAWRVIEFCEAKYGAGGLFSPW